MGWILAWLIIALVIGLTVTGVNFAMLYGFFISGVIVGFCWLLNWLFGGIIDSFFGRKH